MYDQQAVSGSERVISLEQVETDKKLLPNDEISRMNLNFIQLFIEQFCNLLQSKTALMATISNESNKKASQI